MQRQGLVNRQQDEVEQLCRALMRLWDEMAKLAPALHQADKARTAEAKAAAVKAGQDAAAAALAQGLNADSAAVAATEAIAAAARAGSNSNNLSPEYVSGMRIGLDRSALVNTLPPACQKV
jgi:hypothetical protein